MAEPTLDAVALRVLQLEPDDRGELRRVRAQLAALALGDAVAVAARPLVMGAVEALASLVEGTAADPAVVMRAVGALLERALQADDALREDVVSDDVLPGDLDSELLAEFLAESRECLRGGEAALLALEQAPGDAETLHTVFRAFHTIKGTSAFFGLTRVSAFAHAAESLLARVRDGGVAYDATCAELALRAVDVLTLLVDAVDAAVRAGGPGARLSVPAGYAALVRAIASHATADPATAPGRGELSASWPRREDSTSAAHDRRTGDRRRGERRQTAAPDADQFLRVRTDRLDRLVDMVSELVIAHAMMAGDDALTAAAAADHALAKKLGHAGKLVRGLQELSMGMRMVPLRATFQRLARLARDVSANVGKAVDFVAEGGDTEIDRGIVDLVGDPLVHMVRNAVDHGIESPAERAAAGKPARGTVRLSAYRSGSDVVVELVDDGRGLDRARIARRAVEQGLIATDRGLDDADVFRLIFAPGFSTADVVSEISGRGVGMDVVRRNVERVRGGVEIASRAGEGTTFALRLPLTVAVTDGMLVRVGAERYVVPTTCVQVSFRPEPGATHAIAGRGEVVALRGAALPVVRLHRLFGVAGAVEDPARGLLVVVGDGRRRWAALLVDELLGQQQVVAKPLGAGVGRIEGIAGGAILGDGRVGLILDAAEVIALAERGAALAPAGGLAA